MRICANELANQSKCTVGERYAASWLHSFKTECNLDAAQAVFRCSEFKREQMAKCYASGKKRRSSFTSSASASGNAFAASASS